MTTPPVVDQSQDQAPTPEAARFLEALRLMQQRVAQPLTPPPLASAQIPAQPGTPQAAPLPASIAAPGMATTPDNPNGPALSVPAQPVQPATPPSKPGALKTLLTGFLSGAGAGLLHHEGLPTDYEKSQTAAQLAIQQQAANDTSSYRQAQASNQQSKADQLDEQNKPFTFASDTSVPAAFRGVTMPTIAAQNILKVFAQNQGKTDTAQIGADARTQNTDTRTQAQKDIAAQNNAIKQVVAETQMRGRVRAAEVMGGNRAVQVVDPNNPTQTVFMSPRQAMASGANGTQSQLYQTQKGVQRDATYGAMAKTTNAINTAQGHLKQLGAAADALQNGNITGLNKIANLYGAQTGASAPLVFANVKTALTGELAKAYTGAGATVSEQEHIEKTINDANSPAQLKAVVASAYHLLDSKREALKGQYDAGMQGRPNFTPSESAPAKTGGLAEKYGGVTVK